MIIFKCINDEIIQILHEYVLARKSYESIMDLLVSTVLCTNDLRLTYKTENKVIVSYCQE